MSNWFRVYGFADVQDKLLVGAYPLDSEDVAMLEWMKVERVLNLVEDEEYPPGEREQAEHALAAAGIEERRIRLIDYGRLPADKLEDAVGEVVHWLHEGHRVYLHCRAGWQRSAAVAAGVLAVTEGVDIDEALDLIRRRKPSADPLPQQREDLLQWWADREPGVSPARVATVPDADRGREDRPGDTAIGGPVDAPDGRTSDRPVDAPDGRTSDRPEIRPDDRVDVDVDLDDEFGEFDEDELDDEAKDLLRWLASLDPARRGKGSGGGA